MTSISRPAVGGEPPATVLTRLAERLRGRADEAAWVRPAFLGVVALAAVLYVVNLTVSGFANEYYSAAALAASQRWSAWFFGSIDSANFITVDKPPLATMLMGLSVRLFGLSSWSVLLPEALAGVATVAVLYLAVRRSFGPVAATIAGLVMALSPVAVLIFRYNNPDALLTLLLVTAAWAFLRALEAGRLRWVVLAAVLVGFAFNTKYLQAYLVLPAFAITYLIAAPGRLVPRLGALVIALGTVLVASGWWVLAVELIPASARPYIGGSTTNSALELVFGYDGLGRIFGGSGPGGGGGAGGGAGGGFSGATGLLRLFNAQFGGQISWFIPFSVAGLVTGLALRLRAPRTDRARAAYLMWGLWLAVTAIVFSFMSGVIHSYYAVALAPAVAALVGAGAVDLWSLRSRSRFGGIPLAATILVSSVWAWALLERTPDFAPGLGPVVLVGGALAALVLALPAQFVRPRTALLAAGLGIGILLAGPAAYSYDTMASAHSGGDPRSGPTTADGGFGGGGGFAGGPTGGVPGGGVVPTGGVPGGGGFAGAAVGGGGSGGSDSALVDYLIANRGDATWIVATTSAQGAGSIELASGQPVMAMGGFTGSDPAPSLDQLKALVASGKLRFVLVGSGGQGGPGGGPGGGSSEVDAWVTSVGTVVDYGGSAGTLYDLSVAATTGS
jgi:4-amino-4-deoxy-L-arabinose transferase-like glycosyltransferase